MNISDVTRASWCFKSPATPLFVQQLFRLRARTTSQLHITGYFYKGNPSVTSGSPLQMTNNTEDVSIIWCHRDIVVISQVISLMVPKLLLVYSQVITALSNIVPGKHQRGPNAAQVDSYTWYLFLLYIAVIEMAICVRLRVFHMNNRITCGLLFKRPLK